MIYLKVALSVHARHFKCTVAPKEPYRHLIFVFNFGYAVCVELKKIIWKKNTKPSCISNSDWCVVLQLNNCSYCYILVFYIVYQAHLFITNDIILFTFLLFSINSSVKGKNKRNQSIKMFKINTVTIVYGGLC